MSTEINFIKIEGKPLVKLLDVISKGIGKIYKPRAIKNEADSVAYKIRTIEDAKVKAAINQKSQELEFQDRIDERILFQENKKQKNLDKINSFAAEELKNTQTVSEDPIDDDWITRFFSYAEDITNEEMQTIWGKILAGEVKKPKSFSLRTLELIRNLSKEEAEIFIRVANFTIACGRDRMIFKGNDNDVLEKHNISFDNIALLVEIGIIQPGDFISYELSKSSETNNSTFSCGDIIIFSQKEANTETIAIPIYLYTKIGCELLNLIKINYNLSYLQEFALCLKNHKITSKYGIIIERFENNEVRHTLPLKDFDH